MNQSYSVDLEAAINETKRKIWNEEKILNGAKSMRSQHTNRNVIAELDVQLLETEKRISYLQNKLKELKSKQESKSSNRGNNESPATQTAQITRPNSQSFSKLDLRKSSAALSSEKISLKMYEIAYKLEVEKKLSEATSRMASIYTNDYLRGNKKKMAQVTEATYVLSDSRNKIRLLEQAFKNYQTLYVDYIDNNQVNDEGPGLMQNLGLKRPLSGKLDIKVIAGRSLNRAPTRLKGIAPETYVQIKVDGAIKAVTKPSKTSQWNESFQLHLNKASEIEFCLIERVEQDVLVGIMWIKLYDIQEDLRKQTKPETPELGWAPADHLNDNDTVFSSDGGITKSHDSSAYKPSGETGIQSIWDVEPSGNLELWLNFTKDVVKRRVPEGLGRKAAVRKRKGPCIEIYRHHFYELHTYTIAKCAICEDYLVNSVGQQCEDCNLFVHDKCVSKTVTRCLVGAPSEDSTDEIDPVDVIKYRIPHRFEYTTSLGANWCCHCGLIVTIGRKVYKCLECSVICHSACSTFVPNFCGMKLFRAYEILLQIKQSLLPKPKIVNIRNTIIKKEANVSNSANSIISNSSQNTSVQYIPNSKNPFNQPSGRPVSAHLATTQHSADKNTTSYTVDSDQMAQLSINKKTSSPALGSNSKINNIDSSPQKIDSSKDINKNIAISPSSKTKPSEVSKVTTKPKVKKYSTEDFKFLAVLGKGNFGKVMLAEEKSTKGLYAIKILKKQFISENDEFESTRSEKRVLLIANKDRHPFLIGLHSCFQTDSRVFFVMEYISGGDLMMHIQRQQFGERRAKFYACEVLLGIEYFHKNSIVYRDLKLDNIMLGADGHIKIADYGLCKENMPYGATTHTFCGTPEFMAPEIVLEQRYGKAVDWWAFGVLIYEMLLGQSPFRGEDEDEIFDSILEDEVLYPVNMSRDSVSICQELLERDPNKRLGSGPSDADEVKRHPFFKGANWSDFLNKRVTPPFIPQINGRSDISNFDTEFTRERPVLTLVNYKISSEDQKEFADFDYTAPWAGKSEKWTH
ncbi:Protein kinase C-like 2 [Smittium mucronatum]|uniref:protein kinase C n=1 Tax=Smittium mucronatum TaxID=133383 RepID=A0A1R0GLA8_9FUNG|nr:Protein kinase C-like 2 [Smittium mucronatum]